LRGLISHRYSKRGKSLALQVPYDAAYIALAEALNAVLVTADVRLSRASGLRCEIETIHGASGG
jgi:predicted nucleic acid-binding protein